MIVKEKEDRRWTGKTVPRQKALKWQSCHHMHTRRSQVIQISLEDSHESVYMKCPEEANSDWKQITGCWGPHGENGNVGRGLGGGGEGVWRQGKCYLIDNEWKCFTIDFHAGCITKIHWNLWRDAWTQNLSTHPTTEVHRLPGRPLNHALNWWLGWCVSYSLLKYVLRGKKRQQ
jgi:hypothetical protein